MTLEIPADLYKTLQLCLKGEATRLCRDAAKVLGVPEQELKQKVLNQLPPVPLKLFKTDDIPASCPVLLQHKTVVERCRRSTVLGTGRCLNHQHIQCIPEEDGQLQLTRLQATEDEQTLWVNEATKEVLDASGICVGEYDNEVVTLYSFEE